MIANQTKKTKKIRWIAAALIAASVLTAATVCAYAYDGTQDPLISLSYLLKFKQESVDPEISALNARIAELESKLNAALAGGVVTSSVQTPTVASPEAEYTVVQVNAGTTVLAASPCDIMLRAGTAVAVSPHAAQGLSDYTDGAELLDGQPLTVNHMILIPRDDGRGIRITSDTAYIIIRGRYTLES